MPTLLGGKRWEERPAYEPEEDDLSPIDDDYIPEEYETSDD